MRKKKFVKKKSVNFSFSTLYGCETTLVYPVKMEYGLKFYLSYVHISPKFLLKSLFAH